MLFRCINTVDSDSMTAISERGITTSFQINFVLIARLHHIINIMSRQASRKNMRARTAHKQHDHEKCK